MKKLKFISIDPSLANTAIVWGEIENGSLKLTDFVLSKTDKDKTKKIKVASDTVRRCKETILAIQDIMKTHKPNVCFAETPTGSQSSNAMKGYGVSCAYIALLDPPAIQVTPNSIKKEVNGTQSASKKEVMDWVDSKFPNFLTKKSNGEILVTKMEHVADAVVAAVVGMKTDQFKQIMSIVDGLQR